MTPDSPSELTFSERYEQMLGVVEEFKANIARLSRGLPLGAGTSDAEIARRRRRNKAARKARRQGRR